MAKPSLNVCCKCLQIKQMYALRMCMQCYNKAKYHERRLTAGFGVPADLTSLRPYPAWRIWAHHLWCVRKYFGAEEMARLRSNKEQL